MPSGGGTEDRRYIIVSVEKGELTRPLTHNGFFVPHKYFQNARGVLRRSFSTEQPDSLLTWGFSWGLGQELI